MIDETQKFEDMTQILAGDILFDCPYCGKNMAIEAAGAGLMVPCAFCARLVQVPIPDVRTPAVSIGIDLTEGGASQTNIRQLDAALVMANQQLDRLMTEKEALQERRAYLEQIRMTNASRFDRISAELQTMQDSLERALMLLAEVRAEKPA